MDDDNLGPVDAGALPDDVVTETGPGSEVDLGSEVDPGREVGPVRGAGADIGVEEPEGGPGFAIPDPPQTGDLEVDAALAALADSIGGSLEEQLAAYEAAHRTLQDRLADVEG